MKKHEISVIIAEDEPIILNNIAKKVNAIGDYIYVARKALNGKEVLSYMQENIPDILITDIEMPGMNGLDLIRKVKEQYPQVHILILSSYNNFDYARTALQLGVDDYLLKPITFKALSKVINKIIDLVKGEKHQIERNILSKKLHGNNSDLLNPSSFQDGQFLLLFVTLGNPVKTDFFEIDTQPLFEQINFDTLLCDSSFDHIWVIDEKSLQQKFIILHATCTQVKTEMPALRLLNCMKDTLPGLPCSVMILDSLITYSEIGTYANKMRLSLSVYAKPFAQEHFLYPGNGPLPIPEPEKKKEAFDFVYQLQNSTAFIQYTKKVLKDYTDSKFSQQLFDDFFSQIISSLPILFHIDEAKCMQMKLQILQQFPFVSSLESFLHLFETKLHSLIDDTSYEIGSDNICHKVKKHIVNHYNQHIVMDDLSSIFGYTASYINRLFKKKYGISPMQYQTSLRLDKAKELLKTDITIEIKDIASSIGYDDARYFSRVFKNEFGVTPSEWQSNATYK